MKMHKIVSKILSIFIVLAIFISTLSVFNVENILAAPKNNEKKHTEKTSETPAIEIIYETGTQNSAKSRRDSEEFVRAEDDGSFEVFIPNDNTETSDLGEITVEEDGEDSEIEWEDIYITTPEDFSAFCKNCRLDSWSRNKNVYLDEDIIITNTDFNYVPTFGGHFYGNNHTINGYSIHEPRSYVGLFAYTQEGAVIENLTLIASVKTDGKQIVTGGLVGENHGEIRNCTFSGNVIGQNYVGGIAGYNELTGNILNCKSTGTIKGLYYTGGIAGENVGNISSCVNEASVNTENVDKTISFQEIDLSSYADGIISKITGKAEEKSANKSASDNGSVDTGGIAGISIGVIQFCKNKGGIGYKNVGYNIGGIVGRQSGYVHGCTNEGVVKGRKDVGGIVGQAEPYVVVDYTEDTITKLSENIDKLHDVIDNTLSDAGTSSDTITNRLSIVKAFTDKALDQTSFLSNQTIDWTNGMVGAGNEVMGRAQYIIEETSKSGGPVDYTDAAFDNTRNAAMNLQKTVNDLDIYKYMTETQRIQYDDAKDRFDFLTNERINNTDIYKQAGNNYYIYKMKDESDEAGNPKYPDSKDIVALDKDGNPISNETLNGYGDDLEKWKNVSSWRHADTGEDFGGNDSDKGLSNDAKNKLNNATVSDPVNMEKVNKKAKQDTISSYNTKYNAAISDIDSEAVNQAKIMADIIITIYPAMDEITRKDAQKAAEDLKRASENLAVAGRETKDILGTVAAKGGIILPSFGDDYKNAANALTEALKGMSDNMGALNNEMANSSDVMIGDMSGVNDQFNVIMQLYTDAINGILNEDYSDNIEDSSMEVANTCVDATIADCENTGKIEGDLDVAGIAGAMGIEYDFDLESDLTKSDDATFNSTYQSKCVLRKNKNDAHVIAQKSYVGGICGLQEIGTILSCENYGKVKSNSSDYVGGICGDSLSYIQKSIAKCFLYGKNYIGGIAGHGCNILNSYAMVQVDEEQADSFYGAIAGDIVSEGKVHYNYFVGDKLAGIDRISYKEQAEPISYETFISIDNIPDTCQKIYAVFYIDDIEVDRIETTYGGSIFKDQFPTFEGEDDTYCSWNKDELTDMLFDEEVEGEYIRYITSLASEQMRENEQSAILVDGKFVEGDTIECTSLNVSSLSVDNAIEHWEVTYPSNADEKHLIRYKNPDYVENDTEIFVNNAGKWIVVDTDTFGAYKTFEVSGGYAEFAVKQVNESPLKKILFIVGCILVGIVLILILIKIIKNVRKNNMIEADDGKKAEEDRNANDSVNLELSDNEKIKESDSKEEKKESIDEADIELLDLNNQ